MLDPAGRAVEGELAADRCGDVVAGDLLEHDGSLGVSKTEAAPLLADRDAEQVGVGERSESLFRQLSADVGVVGIGCDGATADVAGEGA